MAMFAGRVLGLVARASGALAGAWLLSNKQGEKRALALGKPEEEIQKNKDNLEFLAAKLGCYLHPSAMFDENWDQKPARDGAHNLAVYVLVSPCEVDQRGDASSTTYGFIYLAKLERELNNLNQSFLRVHDNTSLDILYTSEPASNTTAAYLQANLRDHQGAAATFSATELAGLHEVVPATPSPADPAIPGVVPQNQRSIQAFFSYAFHRPTRPVRQRGHLRREYYMNGSVEVTALKIVVCGPNLHRFFLARLLQLDPSHWNRLKAPVAGDISMVSVDGLGKPKLLTYRHHINV